MIDPIEVPVTAKIVGDGEDAIRAIVRDEIKTLLGHGWNPVDPLGD